MKEPAESCTLWTAATSDVGLVRSGNEDGVWLAGDFVRDGHRSLVIDPSTVDGGVFLAVADGVGGAAAGEVASRFVLEEMALRAGQVPAAMDASSVGSWMVERARSVNDELAARGSESSDLKGMATTLTGIYVRGSSALWINAGDSRLYALREGTLHQVSRDHTLRELLGDPTIPGNIIANCFGSQNEFYLDTGELPATDLSSGDVIYLICSDGLSDYTEHSMLESIVTKCGQEASPAALGRAAGRLVDAAKAGGGGDNITCLLVWPRRA